jgi:alcohol dehydrogenase YqhD (iron-dependent ADH family)
MNSFIIHTPTRILFGPEHAGRFGAEAAKLGRRAFVVTGGGSVSRLGILAEVTDALVAAGLSLTHFSGIEPNPEATTVNRAAAEMRAAGADLVVAVGGGSVMDAAKAIAALVHDGEADIWPFVVGGPRAGELRGALPILTVPTTAATASEVTPYSVLSHRQTHGKSILSAEFLKPSVSWINPRNTVSLSASTTQDGAADIMSHVFENYLLGGTGSPLADRYAEGIIATVLETLPTLLANPQDLAARGSLQWASTLALNDYQNAGRHDSPFVLHFMEHALSGQRPELAHGRGLAVLYPTYFLWLLKRNRAEVRLAQLGARLFGLNGSPTAQAQGFIEHFEQWLARNGLRQSLQSLGFTEDQLEAAADYTVKVYGGDSHLDALGVMTRDDILEIFHDTQRQS